MSERKTRRYKSYTYAQRCFLCGTLVHTQWYYCSNCNRLLCRVCYERIAREYRDGIVYFCPCAEHVRRQRVENYGIAWLSSTDAMPENVLPHLAAYRQCEEEER